ncbi:DCTN6 isoform 2 [Pongo abelii]|uniref:Dynactin subunit 6 n=2 Tax=Hominidae TaxID=9604 RepID=E5RGW9_HUMAN|nr:DCTN6 isoform 2 [Pongo abelii]
MAEKTQKSVKIAPGAVVCVESEIRGDVTIVTQIISLLTLKIQNQNL